MIFKDRINTKLINSGQDYKYTCGAVNSIIQRASSLRFNSILDKKKLCNDLFDNKLKYGRYGTLTHFALQEAMMFLEKGAGCCLFPSGVAAISTSILAFVKSGDHILINNGVYESTYLFCKNVLSKIDVTVTWFDYTIRKNMLNLIRKNTKLMFLESPNSLTMDILDIPKIISIIKTALPNIVIIVDNTWSAGILFNPLDVNADISVQSGTKYVIGHSDAMLGIAVSNERCLKKLQYKSYLMGQTVDADTAYVAMRGLKTLAVRMMYHEKNAVRVAKWLNKHNLVKQVNYPALPNFKGHDIWKKIFLGSNGLLSFILKKKLSDKKLSDYIDNFKYFKIALSWGGYESLILAFNPDEINETRYFPVSFKETLIRLHVGLEHVDSLIDDLENGFRRIVCNR